MIEEIRYLIIFAKVAEIGSISKGAKALGLSNATVSQHLAKLEKNLACALFYRNTRKMTLTTEGKRLLETAQSILINYETGITEFKQQSILSKKKLHISIPSIFIHAPFMQQIASFYEKQNDLTLNITCDDQRSDIVAENIDLAFRIGELPSSALKAKNLFKLSRSIVAGIDFLSCSNQIQHPKDLEQQQWIGLTMRPDSRILRHKETGDIVPIAYRPHLYVNSVEASYALMKLNLGLAAPPDYLIQDDLDNQRIVRVLPEWELEPLNVYAVWHANVPKSSTVYALIDHIYCLFNNHVE